jgi:hypothetical protein
MQIGIIICLLLLGGLQPLKGQRILSEGTLLYTITVFPQPGQENLAEAFGGALQTVWLRGNLARIDFNSQLRKQTTIYNGGTGEGSILRESGTEKYQWNLNAIQWATLHSKWKQIDWNIGSETKEVGGYICYHATGVSAEGDTIGVYFTKQILPVVKGYDPMFINIDGLPVEYETITNGFTVKFSLTGLQTSAVAATRFDIPQIGYKILDPEKNY